VCPDIAVIFFFVRQTGKKMSQPVGDLYPLLVEHLCKVMNRSVIHHYSKMCIALEYICSLTLHLQVSQQVCYAKGMFEERRYTVISNGDGMLED
jgi:hypothetical protein